MARPISRKTFFEFFFFFRFENLVLALLIVSNEIWAALKKVNNIFINAYARRVRIYIYIYKRYAVISFLYIVSILYTIATYIHNLNKAYFESWTSSINSKYNELAQDRKIKLRRNGDNYSYHNSDRRPANNSFPLNLINPRNRSII